MFDDVPHRVFSHVKELEAVGLAAPQVTYILQPAEGQRHWQWNQTATTIDGSQGLHSGSLRAWEGKTGK